MSGRAELPFYDFRKITRAGDSLRLWPNGRQGIGLPQNRLLYSNWHRVLSEFVFPSMMIEIPSTTTCKMTHQKTTENSKQFNSIKLLIASLACGLTRIVLVPVTAAGQQVPGGLESMNRIAVPAARVI